MLTLFNAKDHSSDETKRKYVIRTKYGDCVAPRTFSENSPEKLLCNMLANADKVSFTLNGEAIANTVGDCLPILSANHTFSFSGSRTFRNNFGSWEENLAMMPDANLCVSGEPMDVPVENVQIHDISEVLGHAKWYFFVDTERAAIHWKPLGQGKFELCIFDWTWISGRVNP